MLPIDRFLARRQFVKRAAIGGLALPMLGCSKKDSEAGKPQGPGYEGNTPFPELTDQRAAMAPISPEERAARRKRLGEILSRRNVDAYLCEHGPTMKYLSGIEWGLSERLFALIVLADGSHFFLSPAFEAEKARLKVDGSDGPGGEIVAWQEHEYAFAPLAAALTKRRVERIALDPSLRLFAADGLRRELKEGAIVSGQAIRTELRGVKDDREISLLRKACELTQLALGAASKRIHVGMSGRDISNTIDGALRATGLTKTWDLSLVGPAAAYPHGGPDSQKLERGQFLLIDCGGEYHEYQSDNTRTWVVEGDPDPEALKAWNAVRAAQQAVFDQAAPGKPCGDIDRLARQTIESHGFTSDYRAFTHRLGHGIGMEGHEDPYFDSGSTVPLVAGMTLSNEPGLYFLDRFGIRLEDILVITKSGCEPLGKPQRDFRSPTG